MKRWSVLLVVMITLAACDSAMNSPYGGGGYGGGTDNNSSPPWHVTYVNSTPGTSGTVPTDNTPYDDGTTVHVKANVNLAWPGWTFEGWSTQYDAAHGGKGTLYVPGSADDNFTIHANTTLYGTWSLN